ncbi:MAG: hypothetical protein AVDCRST_MAG88-386, partial [uncultured Thermomicrobiales bacterium]
QGQPLRPDRRLPGRPLPPRRGQADRHRARHRQGRRARRGPPGDHPGPPGKVRREGAPRPLARRHPHRREHRRRPRRHRRACPHL